MSNEQAAKDTSIRVPTDALNASELERLIESLPNQTHPTTREGGVPCAGTAGREL